MTKNRGFTVYEVLITIFLLGIISSLSLPCINYYFKEYKKVQFEQKVMLFERRALDCIDKYKIVQYGSTEYTSNVKISIDISTNHKKEMAYIDHTNPESINYLVYEIIIASQFEKKNYNYEYSPATIEKLGVKKPSKFIVYLEDNIVIEFNMLIYSTENSQSALFNSITVKKDEYFYTFEV